MGSLQGVDQPVQFTDITVSEDDQWAGLDLIWTGLFPNKIPNLVQNELSKYSLAVKNDGAMGRTLITQTLCILVAFLYCCDVFFCPSSCVLRNLILFVPVQCAFFRAFIYSFLSSIAFGTEEKSERRRSGMRRNRHEIHISAPPA